MDAFVDHVNDAHDVFSIAVRTLHERGAVIDA